MLPKLFPYFFSSFLPSHFRFSFLPLSSLYVDEKKNSYMYIPNANEPHSFIPSGLPIKKNKSDRVKYKLYISTRGGDQRFFELNRTNLVFFPPFLSHFRLVA